MNYNTSKEHLIIREYGRNIQNIVNHCITLKDREKRNQLAYAVIELMAQTNPQFKNFEEYRHKLWDHLFIISNYKLDVDAPYPMPKPEDKKHKTIKPLPYPKHKIKYKHYGKNVERVIEKGIKTTDEDKRRGLAEAIANYMKLVSKGMNKDNLNDDSIKLDLEQMSGGKLVLDKDTTLAAHHNLNYNDNQNRNPKNNNFRRNNKNFRKNNNNNNRRRPH